MFACGKGRVAGRKEKRPRKKGKGGYTQKEKGKETYRSPASCFYVSIRIHGVHVPGSRVNGYIRPLQESRANLISFTLRGR